MEIIKKKLTGYIKIFYQKFIKESQEQSCHNPETVTRRCSGKKVFLKISLNSLENTYARVSFLNKSYRPKACNFIKKATLVQMFFGEFSEILKTPFFIVHLRWLFLIIE